jgi:predicted TIM-barrel fold metal-dependent hydrolase
MVTLADPEAAVSELEWALERDARVVCFKGGPQHTPSGLTSPGDRRFDRFWALAAESGITVGIHSGDAGYGRYLADWEPVGQFESFRQSPLSSIFNTDRSPFETMGALVVHGVFDRFPKVRVASIEAGSEWVPSLVKKLKKAYSQNPGAFGSDPIQSLREHVWVAPFYEDDMAGVKAAIGVEHILFGSDWPHAEGLAEPRSFAEDLSRHGFTEAEIRTVMSDNGRVLAQRAA